MAVSNPPLLADLVVVEIAGSAAGAYAARLLSECGADVATVATGGRAVEAVEAVEALAWRGGREPVRSGTPAAGALLGRADVVIESSARGPVEALGWPVRPGALRVQVSPFGSTGPYASWSGADIVDQAVGGYLYLSGEADREPLIGPVGQAALAAGAWAAIGTMAALHRRRAGEAVGCVEVTHHEAVAALHQFTDVRYTHAGNVLTRMGNRYAGPGSPIGMYRAADGWVAITVSTVQHAETLLAITGLEHLLDRPDVDTIIDLMVSPAILDPAFTGWLSQWSVREAVEYLQAARIAAAPVLTMRQVLDDPHLAARDWWRPVDVGGRTVRAPGPPFRITAVEERGPAGEGAGGTPRPLRGTRVLDLTRVWAGPLAARILGDLGADVVMVEAPWGRGGPEVPASYVTASHFFPDDDPGARPWNRNGFVNKFALGKRSVGLDIVDDAGRDAFEALVRAADVVIENYSPRVMPNLGLGEHRLHELNPALIYVTMPGYGRTGPARGYSAYGPVLDSHAGLSTLMGYPGVDAWKCGIAWPDPVAGIHAAFAALAALWHHRRPAAAGGATIEVAQLETAVGMVSDRVLAAQLDGADPPIIGNRHPRWAPQGVYRGAGRDRWLALAVPDDVTWHSLCDTLGLPAEWAGWREDERRRDHDRIDERVASWSAELDPHDATALLQRCGVPAAPVVDGADLVEDPHLAAAGFFAPITHPEAGTQRWHRLPIRFDGVGSAHPGPAPCLGAANAEVLAEWGGLDEGRVHALESRRVLSDRPVSST